MDIKRKWELICRYISIKKEASTRKVKFYKTKELFQKSKSFDDLLNSMEDILKDKTDNISLFDSEDIVIKEIKMELPALLNNIILFDEYKNYPFLSNVDSWKVPFLFIRGKKDNLEEILYSNNNEAISIVGSRETPDIYKKWIDERMPDKKIIVSGLANGADLIGHRIAIQKNKRIVVFPGYDISKNPSKQKMDVWNYALQNGLIISSVVPGVKTYVQADLIKRNYEMAKVVSASYALYFGLKSGTMNHLKQIAEDNKKIFVPKNIFRDVQPLIENESIRKNMEAV